MPRSMSQRSRIMTLALTWMLSGAGLAADGPAEVDIKAQPLAEALTYVAEVFDLEIAFFPEDVQDIEAPALSGRYTADEVFTRLLEDTPLEHRFVGEDSVAVVRGGERTRTRPEPGRRPRGVDEIPRATPATPLLVRHREPTARGRRRRSRDRCSHLDAARTHRHGRKP